MRFRNKNILTEAVAKDKIVDAINSRRVVTIYYDGDHIINKGYRDIEVFCYGNSKWGHDSIRAWQIRGATDTPNGKPKDPLTRMPGWRVFRVDRIKSFTMTMQTFNEARPKYNPNDKDMKVIYASAAFDDHTNPNKPIEKPLPTTPEPQPTNTVSEPAVNNTQQEPTDNTQQQSGQKRNFLQRIADKFKNFLNRNN